MAHNAPKKSSKHRQKRDSDATKAAFIAAGERVFAARGFDGATLDLLAAEAGHNKALVSYYFGSKEGLYDAVIVQLVDEVVAVVSSQIIEGGDPVKNFRAYIHALALAFTERDTFPSILMREFMGGAMQERETPFQQVLQFYKMTERLYEAGRKQKLFRKLDPHQLHLSIIGPLVHFVLTRRFRERTFGKLVHDVKDPTVADFSKHLERLLLNGIMR